MMVDYCDSEATPTSRTGIRRCGQGGEEDGNGKIRDSSIMKGREISSLGKMGMNGC